MAQADRGRKVSIGFMVLWLIVWGAAILIAVRTLGGEAWSGDLAAAAFLAVWLAVAGFGLLAGIRRLVGLATGEPVTARRLRPNRWNDGMAPPGGAPAQAAAGWRMTAGPAQHFTTPPSVKPSSRSEGSTARNDRGDPAGRAGSTRS